MAFVRYRGWFRGAALFAACVIAAALLRPLVKGLIGLAVDAAIALLLAAAAFLIIRSNIKRKGRGRPEKAPLESLPRPGFGRPEIPPPAERTAAVSAAEEPDSSPATEVQEAAGKAAVPHPPDKASRVEAELDRLKKELSQQTQSD